MVKVNGRPLLTTADLFIRHINNNVSLVLTENHVRVFT